MRRAIGLLRLSGHCVFDQLRLEEALLRKTRRSWCVINDGVQSPAVVMGISGKLEKLVDAERARDQGVQVIKRFTGGGTVVLDRDSILVSLICESQDTPEVPLFPRPLMKWSETFYDPIFSPHGEFKLSETDYTFGDLKFGGNAQYISKTRWLHHTSFLWDYQSERMRCLLHPPKEPEYRKSRKHLDFLCKLKDFLPARQAFVDDISAALREANFDVREVSLKEVRAELGLVMDKGQSIQSTKRIEI